MSKVRVCDPEKVIKAMDENDKQIFLAAAILPPRRGACQRVLDRCSRNLLTFLCDRGEAPGFCFFYPSEFFSKKNFTPGRGSRSDELPSISAE